MLDVGCGDGHHAAAYWRNTNVSFIAVVDISLGALTAVREKLDAIRPVTNQNSVGLVGELGQSSTLVSRLAAEMMTRGLRAEFDIIIVDRVLHHIHPDHHVDVLDQLADLLKSDGRLVFSRLYQPLCPGLAYGVQCTQDRGRVVVHSTVSTQVAPMSLYER